MIWDLLSAKDRKELAFVVQDDAHDYDSYYLWLFKCWVCSCWDGRERQFDGRGACACVNDNKFFVTSKRVMEINARSISDTVIPRSGVGTLLYALIAEISLSENSAYWSLISCRNITVRTDRRD